MVLMVLGFLAGGRTERKDTISFEMCTARFTIFSFFLSIRKPARYFLRKNLCSGTKIQKTATDSKVWCSGFPLYF
jgi:hypothetical protein